MQLLDKILALTGMKLDPSYEDDLRRNKEFYNTFKNTNSYWSFFSEQYMVGRCAEIKNGAIIYCPIFKSETTDILDYLKHNDERLRIYIKDINNSQERINLRRRVCHSIFGENVLNACKQYYGENWNWENLEMDSPDDWPLISTNGGEKYIAVFPLKFTVGMSDKQRKLFLTEIDGERR